jgi:hypothetical protein
MKKKEIEICTPCGLKKVSAATPSKKSKVGGAQDPAMIYGTYQTGPLPDQVESAMYNGLYCLPRKSQFEYFLKVLRYLWARARAIAPRMEEATMVDKCLVLLSEWTESEPHETDQPRSLKPQLNPIRQMTARLSNDNVNELRPEFLGLIHSIFIYPSSRLKRIIKRIVTWLASYSGDPVKPKNQTPLRDDLEWLSEQLKSKIRIAYADAENYRRDMRWESFEGSWSDQVHATLLRDAARQMLEALIASSQPKHKAKLESVLTQLGELTDAESVAIVGEKSSASLAYLSGTEPIWVPAVVGRNEPEGALVVLLNWESVSGLSQVGADFPLTPHMKYVLDTLSKKTEISAVDALSMLKGATAGREKLLVVEALENNVSYPLLVLESPVLKHTVDKVKSLYFVSKGDDEILSNMVDAVVDNANDNQHPSHGTYYLDACMRLLAALMEYAQRFGSSDRLEQAMKYLTESLFDLGADEVYPKGIRKQIQHMLKTGEGYGGLEYVLSEYRDSDEVGAPVFPFPLSEEQRELLKEASNLEISIDDAFNLLEPSSIPGRSQIVVATALQQNPAYPLLVLEDSTLGEAVEQVLQDYRVDITDDSYLISNAEKTLDDARWVIAERKSWEPTIFTVLAAIREYLNRFGPNESVEYWQERLTDFLTENGVKNIEATIDSWIKDPLNSRGRYGGLEFFIRDQRGEHGVAGLSVVGGTRAKKVKTNRPTSYTLGNVEILAQRHASFKILPKAQRNQLEPGRHWVKLVFLPTTPLPSTMPSGERMWVQVTQKTPTGYKGKLGNISTLFSLRLGSIIEFKPEHVADIIDVTAVSGRVGEIMSQSPTVKVEKSNGTQCLVTVLVGASKYQAYWPCKKGKEPKASAVLSLFVNKPNLFTDVVTVKVKKTAAKKSTKKSGTKKPAAKKSTKKPAAKKSTKKPAAKKSTKKPAAKKSTKKPAAKKSTKKPAAKKSSPKKSTKKPAAKKSTKKSSKVSGSSDLPVTIKRTDNKDLKAGIDVTVKSGGKTYRAHYPHITTKARIWDDFQSGAKKFK